MSAQNVFLSHAARDMGLEESNYGQADGPKSAKRIRPTAGPSGRTRRVHAGTRTQETSPLIFFYIEYRCCLLRISLGK